MRRGRSAPDNGLAGRAAQSERRVAGTPAIGRFGLLVVVVVVAVVVGVAVISAGLDLITMLVGVVVIEVGAAKLFSNPCSVSAAPRRRKVINELVAQHALLQPRPPPTTTALTPSALGELNLAAVHAELTLERAPGISPGHSGAAHHAQIAWIRQCVLSGGTRRECLREGGRRRDLDPAGELGRWLPLPH